MKKNGSGNYRAYQPNLAQRIFFMQHILFILPLAGFASGFIDSIAGGGGLISLPAILLAGIPPHMALGTNKLASTFGSFRAALTFIRRNIVNPLLWRAAILATFCGAIIGVSLSHLITADALKKIIPLFILAVAVYMGFFSGKIQTTTHSCKDFQPPRKSSAVIGLTLGCYDGFLGPGTGSFWTTAVMAVYKLDLLTASGVARCMNFVSNIVALLTFMLLKNVNYSIGLLIGMGILTGAYVGSHTAIRYGAKFIKPIFLISVVLTACYMMWRELH